MRSLASGQRSFGLAVLEEAGAAPVPPVPAGPSSPRPAAGVECGGVWNAWTRLCPTERPGFVLQGPPHKCALIFADNSGVDVILGVFPFVRELLSRGTEVSVQGRAARPLPGSCARWGWRCPGPLRVQVGAG